MSKGLEALKVLVMSSTTLFNTKEQITNAKETIEKELNELEKINSILKDSGLTFDNLKEVCFAYTVLKMDGVDKKLKALEIIKSKPVSTNWFIFYKDYDEYYLDCEYANTSKRLTEEEYNLLKEVLL